MMMQSVSLHQEQLFGYPGYFWLIWCSWVLICQNAFFNLGCEGCLDIVRLFRPCDGSFGVAMTRPAWPQYMR
jgi:hypothetical protein